jgi:uncharacterized iron-regulated protein
MPSPHLVALLMVLLLPSALAAPTGCGEPGQWLVPPDTPTAAARPVPETQLLGQLANKSVVLLGEIHDRADDHRWQLDMLTALWRQQPDMAIGFEMFPRRLQPVLDRWVAGELDEQAFLRQAEWEEVWSFDARMYLPLFRFAREHKLPMLALNVERALVKQVATSGWAAVPASQREEVGQPTAPLPEHHPALRAAFGQHPAPKDNTLDDETRFARFVEAQSLWDRAMAEGIVRFRQTRPGARVVGILGAGHLRHGLGVPHQLRSLGTEGIASLLTLPSDRACTDLAPGLADAVFVIPPQPDPFPPPRLGVSLQATADGVMIEKVMPDSLAEKTGLRPGDVIVEAAGSKVASVEEVRGHVQRQPPGTWLPLLIRRGQERLEMVARFPPPAAPAKIETAKP